jgi:hypothetical protein
VEGDRDRQIVTRERWGWVLLAAVLAGGILATLLTLTAGFGLAFVADVTGRPGAPASLERIVSREGLGLLMSWGGAAGALLAIRYLRGTRARASSLVVAAVLIATPLMAGWRP